MNNVAITVNRAPNIRITRKTEPAILKQLDGIKQSLYSPFADSIIVLTQELYNQADIEKAIGGHNINLANIHWGKYQDKLQKSLFTYTNMASQKTLDREEYGGKKESVKKMINPWLKTNARTEALDVSERSKRAFRKNFHNYFAKKEEKRPTTLIIKNSLGLTPKYTTAVNNFFIDKREDDKMGIRAGREKTLKYIRDMRRVRAEKIAQTEIWEAMNKTRIIYHDHLFMSGILNRREIGKEWIAREKACKKCKRYDGMIKKWSEGFGQGVKFPPAHVGDCSCVYRLVQL